MSIFERALGAKGKPVDPATLQTRLADANRRIRELESQFAAVALEWAAGGSTEAVKRDRLETDLTTAKRDCDALRAALALACEVEAARERENAAALRAKQVRAVVQHLRARTRAAADLSNAIALAVAAFRDMVNASDKARAANPIGGPWPMGGLIEFHEIKRLVEVELYRLSQVPGSLNRARSFPGSDPHNITLPDPASLKPIAEALQAADDFVIASLKGRADVPAAPPVMPAPVIEVQHTELPSVAEHADFNPEDLSPGTRSAAEIQATIPRQKLSVTE